MYEPFKDYGSQQPGETYDNFLQRFRKFLDAQSPYEGPASSSSSDGSSTPATDDSENHGQKGANQIRGKWHSLITGFGLLINRKENRFSSSNQISTAAIINDVKIQYNLIDDVKIQYNQKCLAIAHDITDENVIIKTRSGSTFQAVFYELDCRWNATFSREYLSQNHKQRTPAEHRQKQWLFDLIGRRHKML